MKGSIEQFCRDVLEVAMNDGLVVGHERFMNTDPQIRTAGDLALLANFVSNRLAQTDDERPPAYAPAHMKTLEVFAGYDFQRDAFALNVLEGGDLIWDRVVITTKPYARGNSTATSPAPSMLLPRQAATELVNALIAAGVRPGRDADASPIVAAQREHIKFAERVADAALTALVNHP